MPGPLFLLHHILLLLLTLLFPRLTAWLTLALAIYCHYYDLQIPFPNFATLEFAVWDHFERLLAICFLPIFYLCVGLIAHALPEKAAKRCWVWTVMEHAELLEYFYEKRRVWGEEEFMEELWELPGRMMREEVEKEVDELFRRGEEVVLYVKYTLVWELVSRQ